MKRALDIITTIIVVLVVLLAVALVGTRLLGLQAYVVQSGSMEPAFPVGSVVYVQPTGASDVKTGDVITYAVDDEALVTHRVTEVVDDGGTPSFRTKGDANEVEDAGLVSSDQVVGKALVAIPYLGYLVEFLHSTYGRVAAIAGGIALVLLIALSGTLRAKKPQQQAGEVSLPRGAREA